VKKTEPSIAPECKEKQHSERRTEQSTADYLSGNRASSATNHYSWTVDRHKRLPSPVYVTLLKLDAGAIVASTC